MWGLLSFIFLGVIFVCAFLVFLMHLFRWSFWVVCLGGLFKGSVWLVSFGDLFGWYFLGAGVWDKWCGRVFGVM